MAKIRTYQCPGTANHPAHTFDYLHHPSDDPAPRFCPKCGHDSEGAELEAAIVSPHVSDGRAKALSQSADETYRKIEAGSAERAAMSESITGEKADDLKITDLKTNLQYGEIAVPNVVNDVTRTMDAAPSIFGFRDNQNGSGYAAAAHTGLAPNGTAIKADTPHAGLRAANKVADFHRQQSMRIVKSGEQGRY